MTLLEAIYERMRGWVDYTSPVFLALDDVVYLIGWQHFGEPTVQ